MVKASSLPVGPTEFHPILVHFPISLLVVAFLMDLIYWRTRNKLWAQVSLVLLVLGVVFGVLAGLAGWVAERFESIPDRAAVAILVQHRHAAEASVAIYGVVTLWRLLGRGRYPRFVLPYGMMVLGGLFLMLLTGYLGGKLVYEYGVGISPTLLKHP